MRVRRPGVGAVRGAQEAPDISQEIAEHKRVVAVDLAGRGSIVTFLRHGFSGFRAMEGDPGRMAPGEDSSVYRRK